MIYYIRNDVDDLLGFKYNNTVYYYIKNIQDDIIGIIDSNNNIIANYKYDSWGNIISITDNNGNDISNNTNHIANINPFRYRSYYYDTETNLYYLNSRYYNPTWGRFINADGIIGANGDILGYNLYAYCSNNPVTGVDPLGNGLLKNIGKAIAKTAKKIAKKVKKTVKKVNKKVKSIVSKASNFVSNTINNIKKSFSFDVGVGVGLDVGGKIGPVKGSVGYSNDASMNINNAQLSYGSNINYGILGEFGPAKVGLNEEIYHPYHIVQGDVDATVKHHNLLPFTSHIIDCDETIISKTIASSTSVKGNVDSTSEVSSNSFFLGVELNVHVGIGGHIKLGFNIPVK